MWYQHKRGPNNLLRKFSFGVVRLSVKLVEGGVKSTRMMIMLHVVIAGSFVMMWTSDVWQEAGSSSKRQKYG